MLRFIASMVSGRGFGIVCAVVTVLALVGGGAENFAASVLRALDNFFLAFAFVVRTTAL